MHQSEVYLPHSTPKTIRNTPILHEIVIDCMNQRRFV